MLETKIKAIHYILLRNNSIFLLKLMIVGDIIIVKYLNINKLMISTYIFSSITINYYNILWFKHFILLRKNEDSLQFTFVNM